MLWIAPPLTIVFATETGNAAVWAEHAGAAAGARGLPARVVDAATYNSAQLPLERNLLIITSTHEGEPPGNAADFFDELEEGGAPLPSLRFAVLALGDSGYDDYCAAGRRIDHCLGARGACRLIPRCDLDVGEKAIGRAWISDALERLAAGVVVPLAAKT